MMDRTRFLFVAILAATGAALPGCGKEPGGEYRTYSETLDERGPSASEPIDSDIEAPDIAAGDPADDATPGPDSIAADDPIEPELAPNGPQPEEPAITAPRQTAGDVRAAGPPEAPGRLSRAAESLILASRGAYGLGTAYPGALDQELAIPAPAAKPGGIRLLIPEQTFKTEGPEGAIRISYDDLDLLKVLNMEPVPPDAVSYFPEWLLGLDGRRIRVRGFMYPSFQETGLTGFVLARDNQICCFGRNPKIYDLIEVAMRDGETTSYIQGRPFDVVGVLHIRPESDDGELYQLYQIDDAIVIDR